MKKILLFLCLLIVAGCQDQVADQKPMVYVAEDFDVTIYEDVETLARDLPGKNQLLEVKEEDQRLTINYKVETSFDMEEEKIYWHDFHEKIFAFNGWIFFKYNPNLQEVMFFLNTPTQFYNVHLKRKLMEEAFSIEASSDIQTIIGAIENHESLALCYENQSLLIIGEDDC